MNAEELFDVHGHVAVVTGAASGLGLAMAEVMADNGARVVMLDINKDGLKAQVDRLRARNQEIEGIPVDVGDSDALIQTIDSVARKYGRLDAVFANAGISTGPGYATEAGKISGQIQNIPFETWSKAFQVNLTSVFATIKAAAPHMKARREGSIIVTASRAALRADTRSGHPYSLTKAAVAHLVRTTARELGPYNVRVNAIAPGPFRTNIGGGHLADPKVVESFVKLVPLGRMAETDELKGLALFLGSPAASFVSGAVIPIDGAGSG
jgi:NAD(P)-dependent dehydrogenase (short-subunit alcohol dehydrogenase family)